MSSIQDRSKTRQAPALFLAFALSTLLAAPASAQTVADFYRGKTVRLIVGYGAGGGHDANARLLARYIGQYIPGNPHVLVQNMPGAASLKAIQYLDNGAATDGTVFVTFNSGLVTESLTKPDEVPINLNHYAWIGSLSQEIRVCFVRTDTGIKTWNDVLKNPRITFGETGRGSASYVDGGILKDILGVKLKIVFGYAGGSSEKELAVERGELDGDCVSFSSIPKDWIKNHKVVFFSRGSTIMPAGLPPDTPYIVDLTGDPEKRSSSSFSCRPRSSAVRLSRPTPCRVIALTPCRMPSRRPRGTRNCWPMPRSSSCLSSAR